MKFDVSIEDNKYMEKFFKTYAQYEDAIRDNIFNKLPDIINFRPHKIKAAYHLKRNNHTILEYKIIVGNMNFRAAYTQIGNQINIFYISSTTIKRQFVQLLENTSLVD